jgi:alanine-glyoxylate transaminase/(R)-3-amino-2-methylpropionate-pyruvate transaminase
MPGGLKICYFVDSGSEANDLRLLMGALTAETTMSSRFKTYTAGNAAGMELTGAPHLEVQRPAQLSRAHVIAPDLYRGAWARNHPHAGHHYAGRRQKLDRPRTFGD